MNLWEDANIFVRLTMLLPLIVIRTPNHDVTINAYQLWRAVQKEGEALYFDAISSSEKRTRGRLPICYLRNTMKIRKSMLFICRMGGSNCI